MRALPLTLLCIVAPPLAAQTTFAHDHHDANATVSVAPLLQQVRKSTEVFSDRAVAIARGYRLVGRDLPMMGEHWLNVRLLVDGVMDLTHPQILTYLDVGGKPVLTGVVYAVVLAPGERPPDVFAEEAMWHEHNGNVDDEALVPEHHTRASTATGTRVAFLHVWTEVQSPESVFEAENWALPFVRAGLPIPQRFSNHAARSVSLMNEGAKYYMDIIGSRRDSAIFDRYAVEVGKIVSRTVLDRRPLTEPELASLDGIWRKLLLDIEQSSGTDAMKKIKGSG